MGLPPRNGLAARGGGRRAAASHGRRELPDASVSVLACLAAALPPNVGLPPKSAEIGRPERKPLDGGVLCTGRGSSQGGRQMLGENAKLILWLET